MEGVIKLLEGFENLAYRILMLVIIIPKTLLKIIFEPTWVPVYIKSQLEIVEKNKALDEKTKSPVFVDYFSPVLLLMVLALVPALLLSFLPATGVEVQLSNGQESAPAGGSVALVQNKPQSSSDSFIAKASFSSIAKGKGNEFKWWVTKENSDTPIPGSETIHKDSDLIDSNIVYLDDNTVQDTYGYKFDKGGRYQVHVEVSNFSGTVFSGSTSVIVKPTTTKEFRAVPDFMALTGNTKEKVKQSLTFDSLSGVLKKDTTIFLAIALMLPPLFFAYFYRQVTRKNMNEQQMRESFYAECYYFSPLSLAIWAFYYSLFFLTQGTFSLFSSFRNELLLFPPLLALIWFVWVETTALADENKEDNITRPKALFIVLFCVMVMGVAGYLIYVFTVKAGMKDFLRENLIWPYLGISIGLMAMYILNRRKARKIAGEEAQVNLQDENHKKTRSLTFRKLIIPLSVSTIVICCLFTALIFSPEDPAATASSPGTGNAISTPLVPLTGGSADVPLYYTEEFDQDNGIWYQTVYGGTYEEAVLSYEDGSARILLSPQPDQFLSSYLIRVDKEYPDVQVETSVKSGNSNANTVSLICRQNDNGWYEFEISNSGDYNIYQVDQTTIDDQHVNAEFTALASGNTSAVNTDGSENRYKVICKGNALRLYVNDTSIGTFHDPKNIFKDGRIGVAVYSPENEKVDMAFKSVTISEPPVDIDLTGAEATAVPVAEVLSSETATPEAPQSFVEEFDGNLDRWKTIGDQSQVKLPAADGRLHFQLTQKNGQTPPVYFINKDALFGNIEVKLNTTNNGNNSNGVDLVCQLNDKGWYEFELSNSGEYAIYAFDLQTNSYNTLTSGNSPAIKTGPAENTYAAKCQGNELTLVVNGTPIVEGLQDTKFNFTEGQVGFGVSSRKGFPVDLYIESVKVSEP